MLLNTTGLASVAILLAKLFHSLIHSGTVELENETDDANTGSIFHEWLIRGKVILGGSTECSQILLLLLNTICGATLVRKVSF